MRISKRVAAAAGLGLVLLWACTPIAGAPIPVDITSSPVLTSTPPVDAPASTAPTGTAALSSASPGSTAEPAAEVKVTITIAHGEVEPNGERLDVKRGQRIRVTARSDVAQALHIHGDERDLAIAPETPAELAFTADKVGVFEIETHEPASLLVRLVVW